MFKKTFMFVAAIALIAVLFTSCSKDEEVLGGPTVTFITTAGYTSADVTLLYQDTVMVGISAVGNGSDNIKQIKITANEELLKDTAVSQPQLELSINIIKGVAATETWKFEVIDVAGHSTIKTLVLSRVNLINSYNVLLLGAQDNPTDPSFLSTSDGVRYMQAQAFENQAKIDLFCFYENTASHQNMMTLASPGSNITGIFTGTTSPENYTIKNVTFFVKTTLTAAQFDAITTDEAILSAFDNDNKFKKAKQLAVGEVYAIKVQSGKYGMFKVTNVTGTETGKLEFTLKMQK
jgi:hypothetical protein